MSQNELVVSFGRMGGDMEIEIYAHKTFANTGKGFVALLAWVAKLSGDTAYVRFVMEATGVYHEKLAFFLDETHLPRPKKTIQVNKSRHENGTPEPSVATGDAMERYC